MARGTKTGGRQKGTPNKTTAELKSVINKLIGDYQDSGQMAQDLMSIEDPRERLTTACKLMEYVIPKMRSVETDVHLDNDGTQTLMDKLKELSQT